MLPQGVARSSCAPSSNTTLKGKSSCQTSTNLLNTCLVIKLTECGKKTKEGDNTRSSAVRLSRWENPAPSTCNNRPQAPLECCLPLPVRFCLKSDHVRTVSEKDAKLSRANTGFSPQQKTTGAQHVRGKVRVEKCSHETVHLIVRASHLQTQTAHSSHRCPKNRENTTKHRTQFSPLSSTPRKCHESIQNSQKYHKNMAKTTN